MDTIVTASAGFWGAIAGAAMAFALCGIGSSIGIAITTAAGTGVLTEDDTKLGQLLPLIAMPSTNGIYGFIVAVLVMVFFGILDGNTDIPASLGLGVFLGCQPLAWVGLFSGIYQARACASSIQVVAAEKKTPSLIFPALIETYTILSLIITILILLSLSASFG